jgi:hypothetical protein
MSRAKKNTQENISEITITNEKIISFYNKHKHIDIEQINLKIIDMFETLFSSSLDNPTVVTNILTILNSQNVELNNIQSLMKHSYEINNKELNNMKELQSLNISNIKSDIEYMKSSLLSLNSNLTGKIYEIKDNYISELKEQLNYKESSTLNILSSVIEKLNSSIIDKMTLMLSETLPKIQMSQTTELISKFKNDLLTSLNTLNENDPEKILDKLSMIFDNKYNSLITSVNETLINNISQSEIRLTTNIEHIKTLSTTTSINQETINNELLTYLNKYKNSSTKGNQSETALLNILTKEFTTAEISRTSNLSNQGDFIMKKKDKVPILFENKDYTYNVNKDEVDKFIRDIEKTEYHGIFISQHSGIVGKENYQLDIHNKNILIYIHNCDYDITKINLAVNVIELLNDKIQDININEISISNDLLKDINNELLQLINTRDKILTNLKDYYKRTLELCNEISLPNLENYISTYFATLKKNIIICDICKQFEALNLKSLARHKTSCKNKLLKNKKTSN